MKHDPKASYGQWVYPRACGGTGSNALVPSVGMGLSPRMRGNPIQVTPYSAMVGSIPAHAGEPSSQIVGP